MATLYICVFETAAEVALGPPVQEMAVTISGTSADSAAIGATNGLNKRCRLFTDQDCFVTWGAAPTAVNDGTDGRPLGAENPEYFDIAEGDLIAVIERT